jgi:PAS domain S-box-containing protein
MDISHNEIEGYKLSQKLLDIEKYEFNANDVMDNDKTFDTQFSIINVSGNKSNFGIIINANNEVQNTFGYSPRDLIGQNVDMLMPEFYSSIHEQLMLNFFVKDQSKVVDKNRLVFGMGKNGYLKLVMLRLKLLPDLSHGV